MKYILTLALLIFQYTPSHAQITFTNKCEKEVIKLINNSNETIDIAVYSINNDKIVKALEKAKNRNIKIKILTDRIQAFGKSSKVKLLYDRDFDIKIHSKDRIMHHKFAIFDNQKAVEGSFNWTYSAANKNAEDCNIFDNEKDIKTLKRRFKKLWKINEKEPSECYFENMKLNKEERKGCSLKTTKNK
jgi:phosphatidylserine/phosphatidylglycerophosphate/cardiolipin synthase-like enzyme